MAIHARFIQVITLFALLSHFSVHAEQTLTIEEAVRIALERDVLINVYQSRRNAYREQSIAEDTLPDPKIKPQRAISMSRVKNARTLLLYFIGEIE